jgi:hypothetical protein
LRRRLARCHGSFKSTGAPPMAQRSARGGKKAAAFWRDVWFVKHSGQATCLKYSSPERQRSSAFKTDWIFRTRR